MKIKMSKRGGLTFSFKENETFKPGTRYRYIVNNHDSEVVIVPDKDGRYKMSHKGANARPLVDLRNKEIREAMSEAQYMEVEVCDNRIVVHIIKLCASIDTSDEVNLVEALDKSERVTFEIDKETLQHDHEALSQMLETAGMFSEKVRNDISYVFDTVSLFSGAGLLDYPFKLDGSFNLKFAVDFDKSACETYRQNIGDHITCMDIRDLEAKDVPNAELVLGGVCCQGYSNANRAGNTEQDISKRLLIDDYVRIVKEKKPLMFVVENVKQFLTKEKGKYLERVLSNLSSDYHITYSVVKDSDLGGYSKRERMILIGSAKDSVGKVVIPDVQLASSWKKTVGDALRKVTPDWFNYNDVTKAKEETQRKMAFVQPGQNYKAIPGMENEVHHSNVYRRLREDEPSVTITNWRKVNLMPPVGNRILTVAEAAAIMGLGKNYKFFGSLNDRQQQVGNGVTFAIASFVKSIVKNALYRFANKTLFEPVNLAVSA